MFATKQNIPDNQTCSYMTGQHQCENKAVCKVKTPNEWRYFCRLHQGSANQIAAQARISSRRKKGIKNV